MACPELSNGHGDREAAADQEGRDRGEETPEESLASVAERMRRVRGLAGAAQPDGQEHLVHRVGGGVRGLGEHAGGSGGEPGNQLRRRDDDVGQKRDDESAGTFAVCGSPESRRGAALGEVSGHGQPSRGEKRTFDSGKTRILDARARPTPSACRPRAPGSWRTRCRARSRCRLRTGKSRSRPWCPGDRAR